MGQRGKEVLQGQWKTTETSGNQATLGSPVIQGKWAQEEKLVPKGRPVPPGPVAPKATQATTRPRLSQPSRPSGASPHPPGVGIPSASTASSPTSTETTRIATAASPARSRDCITSPTMSAPGGTCASTLKKAVAASGARGWWPSVTSCTTPSKSPQEGWCCAWPKASLSGWSRRRRIPWPGASKGPTTSSQASCFSPMAEEALRRCSQLTSATGGRADLRKHQPRGCCFRPLPSKAHLSPVKPSAPGTPCPKCL